MSAATDGRTIAPRSLRLALTTWPRYARRESGDAVIGVALDMIEAGSSPRREATGLAVSGVGLRIRHVGRAYRAAPWRRAAPLAIAALCALVLVLIGTDAHSWRGVWTSESARFVYDDGSWWRFETGRHGIQLAALGCVASAVTALLGRRILTTALLIATTLMIVAIRETGSGLDFISATIGGAIRVVGTDENGAVSDWSMTTQTGIDLAAAAGLLAGVAGLTSFFWMLSGWISRARGRAVHARPSFSARGIAGVVVAGAVCVLVAPAALHALTAQTIPVTAVDRPVDGTTNAWTVTPIVAMWVAAALAAVGGLLASRRAPAVALASVVLVLALWIPLVWTLSPVLFPRLDSTWAVLLGGWLGIGSIPILAAALITGLAGGAELRRRRREGAARDEAPAGDAPEDGALA